MLSPQLYVEFIYWNWSARVDNSYVEHSCRLTCMFIYVIVYLNMFGNNNYLRHISCIHTPVQVILLCLPDN